jgi:hypothetical protein
MNGDTARAITEAMLAVECQCGLVLKRFWFYDTSAGLPRPEVLDVDVLGNRAIDGWEAHTMADGRMLWAYADAADVRHKMALSDYPDSWMNFVGGRVEETLPALALECIVLRRLVTDWYACYKRVLHHLNEWVVPEWHDYFQQLRPFRRCALGRGRVHGRAEARLAATSG